MDSWYYQAVNFSPVLGITLLIGAAGVGLLYGKLLPKQQATIKHKPIVTNPGATLSSNEQSKQFLANWLDQTEKSIAAQKEIDAKTPSLAAGKLEEIKTMQEAAGNVRDLLSMQSKLDATMSSFSKLISQQMFGNQLNVQDLKSDLNQLVAFNDNHPTKVVQAVHFNNGYPDDGGGFSASSIDKAGVIDEAK